MNAKIRVKPRLGDMGLENLAKGRLNRDDRGDGEGGKWKEGGM